jgi:hypothetical protein
VNWSAEPVADVPPGVVTRTSTVPVPSGDVAVIDISLTNEKLVAGVTPKATAVTPVKPVPVMVTLVPPDAGPFAGLMPVTIGAGSMGLFVSGKLSKFPVAMRYGAVQIPSPSLMHVWEYPVPEGFDQ